MTVPFANLTEICISPCGSLSSVFHSPPYNLIADSPIYEADDIAGTISKLAAKNNFESYLLTGDKDYFQLVDEKSTVLLTEKGITDVLEVTPEYLFDKYGLTPEEFIDNGRLF